MTRPRRNVYVYRLDVTYPEGSDAPGWQPPNWAEKQGDGSGWAPLFGWPVARMYFNHSAAHKRAQLMASYGAVVDVVPSLPVQWPGDPAPIPQAVARWQLGADGRVGVTWT